MNRNVLDSIAYILGGVLVGFVALGLLISNGGKSWWGWGLALLSLGLIGAGTTKTRQCSFCKTQLVIQGNPDKVVCEKCGVWHIIEWR